MEERESLIWERKGMCGTRIVAEGVALMRAVARETILGSFSAVEERPWRIRIVWVVGVDGDV